MVADGMLTRKRYREVPPRVDYELTERAQELMPILGELARWGYEWAWSMPRSAERVDIGAIFRLAAGLVSAGAASGTVECTVTDGRDGEAATYAFALSGSGVTLAERAADNPDARVSGATAAWVSAFSPEQDRGGLQFSGDRSLAEIVLGGLAPHLNNTERTADVA
jgi:hypothetical protein